VDNILSTHKLIEVVILRFDLSCTSDHSIRKASNGYTELMSSFFTIITL